jgi:hypothetical protein
MELLVYAAIYSILAGREVGGRAPRALPPANLGGSPPHVAATSLVCCRGGSLGTLRQPKTVRDQLERSVTQTSRAPCRLPRAMDMLKHGQQEQRLAAPGGP